MECILFNSHNNSICKHYHYVQFNARNGTLEKLINLPEIMARAYHI